GAAPAYCWPHWGSRAALVNYQDLWWNPEEPGWGLGLAHQGNTIFATLFTYDAGGDPLWLIMSAGLPQPDGSFAGVLFRTRGSPFDAPQPAPITNEDITIVGTMTLRFQDGENGMVD